MFISMIQEHRVKYNQRYSCVFGNDPEAIKAIENSEIEPPLAQLVQRWLERTPGLEADGFNFWGKYKQAVEDLLSKQRKSAEVRNTHTCFISQMHHLIKS